MDGALEAFQEHHQAIRDDCFNPCSRGWCARTVPVDRKAGTVGEVSILVLVDGALEVPENVQTFWIEW